MPDTTGSEADLSCAQDPMASDNVRSTDSAGGGPVIGGVAGDEAWAALALVGSSVTAKTLPNPSPGTPRDRAGAARDHHSSISSLGPVPVDGATP